MSSHTPLIIGNWKMNPEREHRARTIIDRIKKTVSSTSGVDVVICPPFVFLLALKNELKNQRKISLGAQDVFWERHGSFTGEISPVQLVESGARYVIVGHSERRLMGEKSEDIARKAVFALEQDMDVVVCVGERERDEDGGYLKWLEEEIKVSLTGISGKYLGQLTIAYEPIWAIGVEEAMGSTDIHEMVIFIRRALTQLFGKRYANRPRIIYGGSVNDQNIEDIMKNGEVDGVLPGRASRDPEIFGEIVKIVKRIRG